MASRARIAVAPLYLFACLVFGGSAQGIWQNMALQLAGLAIIAWAAAVPLREPLPGLARLLFLLAIAAIGIVALQLLPLPSAMWASGNRAHLVDGYRLLGRTVPPLPTSLTPYETLSTLFCIIPPLAMFCAIVRQDTFRPTWLAAALLGGAVTGIVLSTLQVAGAGPSSPSLLASNAIGRGNRIGQHGLIPAQSREVVLETTGKAIMDHMPLGTGLGSFASVYRTYESPDAVTSEYVTHAHNDYAELILELGVPGIVLLLLFLSWWFAAARAIWRKGKGEPFARAASIASAAVLVLSLFDCPLRAAAISSCFAMCLALMVRRRVPSGQEASDLRPARHVAFT